MIVDSTQGVKAFRPSVKKTKKHSGIKPDILIFQSQQEHKSRAYLPVINKTVIILPKNLVIYIFFLFSNPGQKLLVWFILQN